MDAPKKGVSTEALAPGTLQVGAIGNVDTQLESVPALRLVLELLRRVGTDEVVRPAVSKMLGLLAKRAELDCADGSNRFSVPAIQQVLWQLSRHPDFSSARMRDARFVEFGCGGLNPLAKFVPLLALGARECIGFDLESVADERAAVRSIFDTLSGMVLTPELYIASELRVSPDFLRDALADFDLVRLRSGDVGGLGRRLRFEQKSAAETGLEAESVDALTSMSFLEHIDDIDAVLAESARILKPGAIACHRIDGQDHRAYGTAEVGPLDFLKIDTDDAIVHGCNRVRPWTFAPIFERHGFEVIQANVMRTIEISSNLRGQFAEPFRSMDDEALRALGVEFLVRRA